MKRQGYNLVEVLIAMALLAWVVMVISGLFIYGQRGVYSGKTQTRAIAISQKVYEDLKNLPSYSQKYEIFSGAVGNLTATRNFVLLPTPSANTFTAGDVLATTFDGWMAALTDLSPTASMTVVLTPVIPVTGGTASIGNCIFIHYRVQVNWSEGLRNRHVTVDFSI